jgi:energy-coupling factor transport system substrate-specific component
LKKIKQEFKLATWILVPIAVVVNGAGGWIIAKLDLPIYLDTIGTIFVGIAAGPFAGALTGVLTNVLLGLVSPGYIPYWPVPLLIGLTAGLFANKGWFQRWWKVVIVGLVIAEIAAITSTLIAARVFGEVTLIPSYFLIEEPLDKIAASLIAFGIGRFLPERILALLPHPENINSLSK